MQPLGVFVRLASWPRALPPTSARQWLHSLFPQPRAPAAMTSTVRLCRSRRRSPKPPQKDSAYCCAAMPSGSAARSLFVVGLAPYISTQWLHSLLPQPRAPVGLRCRARCAVVGAAARSLHKRLTKDSAIAHNCCAWRAAPAGLIGRAAFLYVCPRLSLGAKEGARICNNLRSCYLVECMRKKMMGTFA